MAGLSFFALFLGEIYYFLEVFMSQLTICLIIFAITVIGYCSGKLSLATFAISSLTALSLTGCLDAKTAVGYFANGNVIMIAGMCICRL